MDCFCLASWLPSRDSVLRPSSEKALQDLLESHGVDTSFWGNGRAKGLSSLMRELREGSCTLRLDNRKNLYRCVEPVFVSITYCGKVLVERSKIFPNGTARNERAVLAEKKA
ncbi:unnamed protein product, partial [Effrenium voratum]